MLMTLEEQMKYEIRKLENEISSIDKALEKLHNKTLELIMLRKKKDRDLKILKSNFEPEEGEEIQTTLAEMLKEKA